MFESLLEKVLNKFLGDFIEGFDASNLHVGIWSGEVTITNVSLKADIIKMLELPLGIKFSHIGKLRLNVPWKSLTSAPVEVFLSDVFIILTAQHPDEWVFQDYAGYKKKFELLEKYKEQIIQKISSKNKAKDDAEAGYVQKLTLKIIDNIQLQIQSIHIRFEDSIKNDFAWGISLASLEVFTTDANWKKKFFDRTKEENKAVPLQKLVTLKNIGAYWNQSEIHFYYKLSKEEIMEKMRSLIIQGDPKLHPSYSQYILLISAEAKLIQNTSGKFDKPEFDFQISLQNIDLALENLQLQQVIRMAEMFSLFQSRLQKKKKLTLGLSEQQILEQKQLFVTFYTKLQTTALSKEEQILFEQAIVNLDIDVLCEEAKHVIKLQQKEQALKQEQEKKKGWGGWFGKKDPLIGEEEQNKLYAFIDELAEGGEVVNVKRPGDYIWFALKFSLQRGTIHVIKQFESKREGVRLAYNELSGEVSVKDESMLVQVRLAKIGIDLVSEPIEDGTVMVLKASETPFLQTTSNEEFLSLTFETNPQHLKGVDKFVKLRTSALSLQYNPLVVVRVQQFADFQVKDDSLKNAAWDQVEAAQDAAKAKAQESQMSPSILFLDIVLTAPVVIVPYQNDAWLLNLGQLRVITPSYDDVNYDLFHIELADLTFKYFPSLEQCQKDVAANTYQLQQTNYAVIQNFKIEIDVKVLRGAVNAPESYSQLSVIGQLPKLDLFVNPLIYSKILKIGECFEEPVQDPEEQKKKENRLSIEKAQTDRAALMDQAQYMRKIWRKNNLYQWEPFTGILSGGYIYLFATAKDQQPNHTIWARNSDFIDLKKEECGMDNAFIIKNKYGETTVACDKPSFSEQWKKNIEDCRTQPRVEQKKSKQIEEKKATVVRPMNFGFSIKGFGLHIQNDQNKDWFHVGISGLGAVAEILNGSVDLVLKLSDLSIIDSIREYKNPVLRYVIRSEPDKSVGELISIQVQLINEKDPRYAKKNLSVQVKMGTLEAILKPEVIARLLVFVSVQEEDRVQINPEKKQLNEAKKAIEQSAQAQQVKSATAADVILMHVDVSIINLKATLVHRFTSLPLAELNIKNTTIELSKYVDEMQLTGSLGNLQLIDLTNHPETLMNEEDYILIVPKEMIGVKESQDSLLKIKMRILSENSPKITDNIAIYIDVEMSQLIINFYMQPVMRLLDFTLQQLLFALSSPAKTLNPEPEEIQEEKQFKQRGSHKNQSIILSQEEQEFLTKQLSNPPGMSLNVSIHNPQVILKPNNTSKNQLVIDLGHIKVTNQRLLVKDRSEIPVWVDRFIITMKDIAMYSNGVAKREFSLPFDFNVRVELFGLSQQYAIKYPEQIFDPQMKIQTFMGPMILQMSHTDYMFLMKCLFHNIAYDDGFDAVIRQQYAAHFQAFFQEQKKAQLQQQRMLEQGDNRPALSFQLDMENLSLYLLQKVDNIEQPVPFLRMMLVMMRVQFQKLNNGSANVALQIRDMEGSVFNPEGLEFEELPFIGPMNKHMIYSLEQVSRLDALAQAQPQGSQAGSSLALASRGQLSGQNRDHVFSFEDATKSDEKTQYKLNFSLQMHLNGDKAMNIDLADFKLMLHAGALFKVLGVIAMDDPELTPPPGKYKSAQEIKPAEETAPAGSLKIEVSLRNVITCIPSNVESNLLAIRGVFNISLSMTPARDLESVRKEVEAQQLPETEWVHLNHTMVLSANLQQIEICLCKTHDLARREDFTKVQKREILAPLDLDVQITKALILNGCRKRFKDSTVIKANLSITKLIISFKDIGIIQAGLNYQLAQMPKSEQAPAAAVEVEKKAQEEQDLSKLAMEQLVELKVMAVLQGTQIKILNDIGNTFTPLLEFTIEEMKPSFIKNNIFQTINLEIVFQLAYYNPRASKWEPVIEKAGFVIEVYQTFVVQLGGGSLITLEQSEDYDQLNITVSTVFVQTLFRALVLIKKMFVKPDEEKQDIKKQSFRSGSNLEDYQTVSPYVVRNMCGYPISVQQMGEKPLQLANGAEQNMTLNEEVKKRVNVSIKIPNKQDLILKDIDMDRLKTKVWSLDGYEIHQQVKLDEITNSKLLIVSSSIVIVNYTNKLINLEMITKNSRSVQKLEQFVNDRNLNHQMAIPFGVQVKISLKFENSQLGSEEVNVEKLIESQGGVATELRIEGLCVILNVVKKNGKIIIQIEPPYRLVNSLPKNVLVQLLNDTMETTETLKLKRDQVLDCYTHTHSRRAYLRVLLEGFYWSDEHKMYSRQEAGDSKEDCINTIKMQDADGNKLSLLVYEPWKLKEQQHKTREFVLHCSGYLLNQSGLQLQFYTAPEKKKSQSTVVAGQGRINSTDQLDNKLIILGPESGQLLEIRDKSALEEKGLQAPIATIGEPQLNVIIRDENNKFQQIMMGCNIYLQRCNIKHTLFSKVISVEPRYIIVNQTRQLHLRAAQTHGSYLNLDPNSRTPFQKPVDNNSEKQLINIRVVESNYLWSGNIDISSIGIVYFQLRHQDNDKKAFFVCDTRSEGCNIFVIIREIAEQDAPYKFINNVPDFRVVIKEIDVTLESSKEAFYAWDDPCQAQKILSIEAGVNDPDYRVVPYKITPDHIGFFKVYEFKAKKGLNKPGVPVTMRIDPHGFQKIISFLPATKEDIKRYKTRPKYDFLCKIKEKNEAGLEEEQQEEDRSSSASIQRTSTISAPDVVESRMNIKLSNFTFSLVHNADQNKRAAEYLVFTIKNLELVKIDNATSNVLQLRIQFLNLDHNSQFFVNYPVVLTPAKYAPYQKGAKNEKYFLNALLMKDPQATDINLFQVISLEIDPFAIKVEEMFIQALLEYISSILNFKAIIDEHEQLLDKQPELVQNHDLLWLTNELPAPSPPTYINSLSISMINVQLTFQLQSKSTDLKSDDMALFKSIAQALGVVLSNIDESPLTFQGLILENCFDSVQGITSKMISFYKNQAISQILKLLGSLSVIGNPVGLFSNVSTGVKDLFERPAQGFTQGPLEGGLGLVQGAGSLVSHTIAGAFNSVNKITGSIGGGLTSLTMDEDYIKKREKLRLQKAKHVGEGLEQGGKALYTGVTQGITGLFMKPFEGARDGGLKGLGKGLFQGVTGLITKPVAGVLDAVSKVAEGTKNTVQFFDEKPNENRARNVRPIYGYEGYFTEYIDFDAEAYAMLYLLKKGIFAENRFVAAFVILPDETEPENKFMLILTLENVIYLSSKTKKHVWIVPMEEFATVDKVQAGVKITVKRPLKQLKDKKETLIILKNEQRDFIYGQLVNLADMVQYL